MSCSENYSEKGKCKNRKIESSNRKNMNKICKGFKNNDYLFLISQMLRYKHCIFSIFN